MILYLDASAIVKLHIHETHTRELRNLLLEESARGARVTTSCVSYAEVLAAFARNVVDEADLNRLNSDFLKTWPYYHVLFLDQNVLNVAGILSRTYRLRGFDALHLASALAARRRREKAIFLVFDRNLSKAAASEGFVTPYA